MLTFRQLDDAGDAAVRLIAETEQAIIDDMARRIARLREVTPATNWQALRLELLGTAQEDILRELSRALNTTEGEVLALFDEAATRAVDADENMYRAAGYEPVPLADNPYLQQTIRAGLLKTQDTLLNLTSTTAATTAQQFERALDLAYSEIVSGAMDYQTAMRRAVRALSQNGIAAITYPTGWVDYLDVAFRRAMLTGVNQTAAEVQLANAAAMGSDLVETTAHPGARPSHAEWQGLVFSLSGKHPKYPEFRAATGYGTGPGLCGWNCRHSFFPYFEGLSDPAYSADKLREYNDKKVTYDGKEMSLYDATQEQRGIERNIRKWKREASAMEAAGLDSSAAKAKVKQYQAAQRDFIDQTGLRRDYFRERAGAQNNATYTSADIAQTLSGKAFRTGNPGKPTKATAPDAVLQNGFNDGIINIPQGAPIADVRVIAGQTTRTPLRDTPRLNADYGGDPTQWQKKVGTVTVDGNPAYIHWYENDGVIYEVKTKP